MGPKIKSNNSFVMADADQEKLSARSSRFGSITSNDIKLNQRAERFANDLPKISNSSVNENNEASEEVLKGRAERFGIKDENSARKARAKRFEQSTVDDHEEKEKRSKRLKRFSV